MKIGAHWTIIRNGIITIGAALALLFPTYALADSTDSLNEHISNAHALDATALAATKTDIALACELFKESEHEWSEVVHFMKIEIATASQPGTRTKIGLGEASEADTAYAGAIENRQKACKAVENAAADRKDRARPKRPLYAEAYNYENSYGNHYGSSSQPDLRQIALLYGKSCVAEEFYEQDNGEKSLIGCVRYLNLWRQGAGLEKNPAKAAALAELMCSKKSYVGCDSFAEMLDKGEGIPQDRTRAAAIYQISCDNADAKGLSCAALGRMYEEGSVVTQDKEKAFGLYGKSCNYYKQATSSVFGCYKKGISYLTTPSKNNSNLYGAFDAFNNACHLSQPGMEGGAPSCYNFALLVANGTPYKKNKDYALSTMRRALKIDPNYAPALKQFKQWGGKMTCTDKEKVIDNSLGRWSC